MNHRLKITIPLLMLSLLGGAYLVAANMANNNAESRLQSLVDEAELTQFVSWESVSQGLFERDLIINKFKFSVELAADEAAELLIDQLVVKNRKHSAEHDAADVYFNKIQIINYAESSAQHLDTELQASFKSALGTEAVPPYDLHLRWDYHALARRLQLEVNTKVPTIAETGLRLELTNVHSVRPHLTSHQNPFLLDAWVNEPVTEDLLNWLLDSKLQHISFNFRDLGFLKIYNSYQLQQFAERTFADRTNKNSTDKNSTDATAPELQALAKQIHNAMLNECQASVASFAQQYAGACATVVDTMTANNKGFIFSAEVNNAASLITLINASADQDQLKKLLEQTTISLVSL